MGERTFGKGSVQTLIPLGRGNTALRLTTARYYTPSGRSVQEGGITPDIQVPQLSDRRLPVAHPSPRIRPPAPSRQRGRGPRGRDPGRWPAGSAFAATPRSCASAVSRITSSITRLQTIARLGEQAGTAVAQPRPAANGMVVNSRSERRRLRRAQPPRRSPARAGGACSPELTARSISAALRRARCATGSVMRTWRRWPSRSFPSPRTDCPTAAAASCGSRRWRSSSAA